MSVASHDNMYIDNSASLIDAELKHINRTRQEDLYGLSFSGGGIRSASFGMGVMQALVGGGKQNILKKIDYLSTVSGGGYLGASLTWFLQQGLPDGRPAGTEARNFPFGQKGVGNRIPAIQQTGEKGSVQATPASGDNSILDYIRQHGKYLTPGKGLNATSLLAIVLRAMGVSLFVYMSLFTLALTLAMFLLTEKGASPAHALYQFASYGTIVLIALLSVLSGLYSLRTFTPGLGKKMGRYFMRISAQRWFGRLLAATACLLVIALIPLSHNLIKLYLPELWKQITLPGIFTALGALSGYFQHKRDSDSRIKPSCTGTVLIYVGAACLLFGITLMAYVIALKLLNAPFAYTLILAATTLIIGIFTNTNLLGIHRMYRDRLMETFMPDPNTVIRTKWQPATGANAANISDMCKTNKRPYHLINCNIVLVNSENPKYRGRCGDSFLLSPLYCGSDATGWRHSTAYMKGIFRNGMTLATAMAISGAAANPNSGPGGTGPSTNRLLSTLMSLLNLRLGFWAENPRPAVHSRNFPPNFFYPGLKGGVLTGGMKENMRAIELSDGGHFENLGIYELIRRRTKVIIVSDASADPGFTFGDLANASERVRVDFGAKIVFEKGLGLEDLHPGSAHQNNDSKAKDIVIEKYDLARRGYALAKITYANKSEGWLIYIKSTLTSGLSNDIYGYKSANPSFPDQSTADQFFDETQFEAYRELGYTLTKQMLNRQDGKIMGIINKP